MVSRSTRRGLIVAALLAAVTYWLASGDGDRGDDPIEGLDMQLDYALENFELRAFDEEGAPSLRLWAPRLTSDAETNIGQVESPRLEVRHEGFTWNMMADTATISDDQQQVFLGGAVHIERNGALTTDRVDIDSSDVTVEVDARVASSDRKVRMADASGTLEATGFRVDMLEDEFQLHSDVQGVYDVPE